MDDTIHPQRAFNDFWRQRASPEESKMAAWGGYPLLEPLMKPVFAMDPEVTMVVPCLINLKLDAHFLLPAVIFGTTVLLFFSSKLFVCVCDFLLLRRPRVFWRTCLAQRVMFLCFSVLAK